MFHACASTIWTAHEKCAGHSNGLLQKAALWPMALWTWWPRKCYEVIYSCCTLMSLLHRLAHHPEPSSDRYSLIQQSPTCFMIQYSNRAFKSLAAWLLSAHWCSLPVYFECCKLQLPQQKALATTYIPYNYHIVQCNWFDWLIDWLIDWCFRLHVIAYSCSFLQEKRYNINIQYWLHKHTILVNCWTYGL